MTSSNGPFSPLAGVRVLDLSRYFPGPGLTRLLCDLGAEVVHVEPPGGDPTRHLPPVAGAQSAAYAALNFGKRSICIDLKKESGVELFLGLADAADIVVESFRPGVLERLGVGWETLHARNRRLVLCSISGYGQQGALRDRAGHDINYIARAGLLGLFGPAGGTPQMPGVQIADFAGGSLTGAVAVLAALLERDQTGVGRHLDISLTRSSLLFSAVEAARRAAGQHEPAGAGLLTGGLPCYGVYGTADGKAMALGALEPKFFSNFCQRVGLPELAAKAYAQDEQAEEAHAELTALFASRTQEEWIELLAGCDCCCEPVVEPEQALRDPALGGLWVEPENALALRSHLGAPPSDAPVQAAVARLGEQGLEVAESFHVDQALIDAALADQALLLPPQENDQGRGATD